MQCTVCQAWTDLTSRSRARSAHAAPPSMGRVGSAVCPTPSGRTFPLFARTTEEEADSGVRHRSIQAEADQYPVRGGPGLRSRRNWKPPFQYKNSRTFRGSIEGRTTRPTGATSGEAGHGQLAGREARAPSYLHGRRVGQARTWLHARGDGDADVAGGAQDDGLPLPLHGRDGGWTGATPVALECGRGHAPRRRDALAWGPRCGDLGQLHHRQPGRIRAGHRPRGIRRAGAAALQGGRPPAAPTAHRSPRQRSGLLQLARSAGGRPAPHREPHPVHLREEGQVPPQAVPRWPAYGVRLLLLPLHATLRQSALPRAPRLATGPGVHPDHGGPGLPGWPLEGRLQGIRGAGALAEARRRAGAADG